MVLKGFRPFFGVFGLFLAFLLRQRSGSLGLRPSSRPRLVRFPASGEFFPPSPLRGDSGGPSGPPRRWKKFRGVWTRGRWLAEGTSEEVPSAAAPRFARESPPGPVDPTTGPSGDSRVAGRLANFALAREDLALRADVTANSRAPEVFVVVWLLISVALPGARELAVTSALWFAPDPRCAKFARRGPMSAAFGRAAGGACSGGCKKWVLIAPLRRGCPFRCKKWCCGRQVEVALEEEFAKQRPKSLEAPALGNPSLGRFAA